MKRWLTAAVLKRALIACLIGFGLIQLIPYGRDHTNPAPGTPIAWDSPRTEELARRACLDCHSDETTWPWYSNVAPMSWLVYRHVQEGRRTVNFSEWRQLRRPEKVADVVQRGEMPPLYYKVVHPGARLSQSELDELVAGLRASVGS